LRYQQGEKGKAIEVATELIKEGLSSELIGRATKLTLDEIEALRLKLQLRKK
jgi:hypothetical protein